MYLSRIEIEGFRIFGGNFEINLNDGLTVILGENGCGKSTIVDAIRLLLNEDEYGRVGTSTHDFHSPMSGSAEPDPGILISGEFANIDSRRQAAFLPWLDSSDITRCRLNVSVSNKEDARGRKTKTFWGGLASASMFEWELMNSLGCIYLPPLRDAETKLNAYRGSRLARLFRRFKPSPSGPKHELENKMLDLNRELLENKDVRSVDQNIQGYVRKSLGPLMAQGTSIQFSEIGFDRIVERLRLLFHPSVGFSDVDGFRHLGENSLGFNNLLYLASVLAELEFLDPATTLYKVLLIEEPEAHLHPQLQTKLLQYLQDEARASGIQIIITTHSPTITAAVSLDALNVITVTEEGPRSTRLMDCKPTTDNKFFLERWLDITKSTLFFAKGLIFVEGIAEALVVKELANRFIQQELDGVEDAPTCLEDFGVSLISLNGIYFRAFFSLFNGYSASGDDFILTEKIPIRCSGITDCDPIPVNTKPYPSRPCECNNPHSVNFAKELLANSANCRVFHNLKTFEYDLGMVGNNLALLYESLHSIYERNSESAKTAQEKAKRDWSALSETDKAEECYDLLTNIEKKGKGLFAQKLAQKLSDSNTKFEIPQYIKDALTWVIGEQIERLKANATGNPETSPEN